MNDKLSWNQAKIRFVFKIYIYICCQILFSFPLPQRPTEMCLSHVKEKSVILKSSVRLSWPQKGHGNILTKDLLVLRICFGDLFSYAKRWLNICKIDRYIEWTLYASLIKNRQVDLEIFWWHAHKTCTSTGKNIRTIDIDDYFPNSNLRW